MFIAINIIFLGTSALEVNLVEISSFIKDLSSANLKQQALDFSLSSEYKYCNDQDPYNQNLVHVEEYELGL